MVSEKTLEQTGLQTALGRAAKLLGTNAQAAEAQVREILSAAPGHPQAMLMLGSALRRQGRLDAALEILAPLSKSQTDAAVVQFEVGLVFAGLGKTPEGIDALMRAVKLNPKLAAAWRELSDQLVIVGDTDAAYDAYVNQLRASVYDPRLLAAAMALKQNDIGVAERLLREVLTKFPAEVDALRMFAEVALRLGRYDDAESFFARCIQLAPGFLAARLGYAIALHHLRRGPEALAQTELLLKRAPDNPSFRNLNAAALVRVGDLARAIELYEKLVKDYPDQPKVWLSYGHALKAEGRGHESIAAYRRSIALRSDFGEAYWSLANIKTFRFTPGEVEDIRARLAHGTLNEEDCYHLRFALGKALEDEGLFAESFEQYEKGNALRRAAIVYDADDTAAHVRRSKALFTPEFFRVHTGSGCHAPDPIFVVGLPRSGSTLIEQILSSHSAIEGTAELPEIGAIAGRLGQRKRITDPTAYPEILASLAPEALKRLGEEYIERTRIQRRSGRPFFVDKMPRNFTHIGLIHLILPNAKIIDARRNPLGCCFSCFKQHFARGHAFTYDQAELGRYYRDYVELMAHFDAVLPRRIHRVIYEDLIENTEQEVRRLLAYCGVPFEDRCLRFFEMKRVIRTPSSEQVRTPIFRHALEHWRNYERWLDPLKAALGPVLQFYPDAPPFQAVTSGS
jgi:tetratricopeptide (TPR) repeat protein